MRLLETDGCRLDSERVDVLAEVAWADEKSRRRRRLWVLGYRRNQVIISTRKNSSINYTEWQRE